MSRMSEIHAELSEMTREQLEQAYLALKTSLG